MGTPDVRINQLDSRVTAMDEEALEERVVRRVLQRMREEREHDERVRAERRPTRSSTPEEEVS